MVKHLPAMKKTQVQSLGQEDPLEKGKANHFSILAQRIPWTVVHGRKELDTTEKLSLSSNHEVLTYNDMKNINLVYNDTEK